MLPKFTRARRGSYLAVVVVLALLLAGGVALAQSGGPYDLSWNTSDGGGGTMTGGSYSLSGTVGQADAGVMTGGSYSLTGGFWGGSGSTESVIYTPLVLRNSG